jgi:TonB-linked SusC/RagA family outer membrane protein
MHFIKKVFLMSVAVLSLSTGVSLATDNVTNEIRQNIQSSATRLITGEVIDNTGDPIIGASVKLKGTTVGTVTDISGKFTINAPTDGTLIVSYIGYKDAEVSLSADRNEYKVTIKENDQSLDEVVVVGYGTQKKINLTGAVGKVEGSDLGKISVVNPIKALQGMSSGITIMDRGGAPGSDDPEIYLRGVSTTGYAKPLILVDGIEMSLSTVPASEIENISILKDAASSSIYGSRGANGVILVTTKRGKLGKVKVSYDGSIGIQDRAVKAEAVGAREYMEMVNEAYVNSGASSVYTEDMIKAAENGTDPYNYSNITDWPSKVFKSNYITQHTATVTGGSEVGKYLVMFDYLDQPGLTENTNYKRYSFRVNNDMNLGKMFRLNTDVTFRHLKRDYPEELSNAVYCAYSMSPICPIYYKNGDYHVDNQSNAVLSYTDTNIVGMENYNKDMLYAQGKLEFEPIKDLIFTGVAAVNAGWDRDKTHYKTHQFYDDAGVLRTTLNNTNGVSDARNNNYEFTLRFLANYNKKIGDHSFAALFGAEQISYRNYYSMAKRNNLISDELPDVSLGSAGSQYADGYPDKWGINSYFGRINYNYQEKYLFEANFRSDGSSRFAKGHKWGYFPSFSAAWRLSEESFIKDISWINNLKIRASWGRTGNEHINEFMYLPQYSVSNVVMNSTLVSAVYQSQMANPDVTWEKVEQTDFGVDFGFLNNRLWGELDWYRKDTKDILLQLGIPHYIGLDAPEQNAGKVRNQGIETTLGWRDKIKDFNYGATLNFSYNKNEWRDRGSDNDNIDGWTIQRVGEALNSYYIYQADGLIANDEELAEYKSAYKSDPRGMSEVKAGDVKLVDVNKDGTIDTKDRVVVACNIPKYVFSLNLTAAWKGFDFSCLFQGSTGAHRQIYGEFIEGPSYEVFTGTHFRDRWTTENQNAKASMPRIEAANNRNESTYNTFFCRETNYVRLKNLQIGYTIPFRLTQKVGISRLRVYASGSNLFTWTNLYQGLDPESYSGRLTEYPAIKIINFGVNVTF